MFWVDNGRPTCPVRLTVALPYLKSASGMSDETVLDERLENPYRQYFTGGIYFEHEYPADPSTMSRWRKKLAKSGAGKMLEESLKTGLREGFIKKSELTRVNVDSSVQEKAVRDPADARLDDRLRERLVKPARKNGIELLKTFLGRVLRNIKRKMINSDIERQKLLELGERLFNQRKSDQKKLYFIHEPQ